MRPSICPYKAFDTPGYWHEDVSAFTDLMSRSYLYTMSHTGICKRIGAYVHVKPSIHLYTWMKVTVYAKRWQSMQLLFTYVCFYVCGYVWRICKTRAWIDTPACIFLCWYTVVISNLPHGRAYAMCIYTRGMKKRVCICIVCVFLCTYKYVCTFT